MKLPSHASWLGTNTGRVIDLLEPDPSQIHIEDIVNNLSNVCRFNGQLKQFYSVLQHSIHVAELVPNELKMQALLHDASEAYICDVPTPLKRMLGDSYRDVERRIMQAIGTALGVELTELDPLVKEADRIMLYAERDALQMKPIVWPGHEPSLKYPNFTPWFEQANEVVMKNRFWSMWDALGGKVPAAAAA